MTAGLPNNNMLCILTSEWVLIHALNTEIIFSQLVFMFFTENAETYTFSKVSKILQKYLKCLAVGKLLENFHFV